MARQEKPTHDCQYMMQIRNECVLYATGIWGLFVTASEQSSNES